MKRNSGKRLMVIAASLVLPGLALCQNISVIVNGDPVSFTGVGPQQVNGRVLVPLRGIMEKLGAYVDFNSATHTVTANKSGIDMVLVLGDRHATLNGRDIQLDVPAQEVRGSTMVPLRFVGEALGAEVRWDAAQMAVNITTTDTGAQTDANQYTPPGRNLPPTTGNVNITSFNMDQRGTVRGGQALRLTMVGTPGGQATFSIPGVIQDVPMTEESPGTYVGTFRVPENSPINVTSASAIARLRVNGAERMMQTDSPLGFDTQPPTITSFRPDTDSRVGRPRPNIAVNFDDRGGSGVDPQSVEIRLDGQDVTRQAQVSETGVTFRPEAALEAGTHDVVVRARDRAGNEVTKRWSFRVLTNRDAIRDFTFDGGADMRPGSEVSFTLNGDPGGHATFSVGDRILDRPMTEVSPGKYVGTYTIRRNDNFADAPVSAKLVSSGGDTFFYDAQNRFSTRIDTLEPPTITEPIEGDRIGDTLVLRGTAAPGSRVAIRVDYSRTELAIIKVKGTAADMEVTADDRGRWQTEPIDIRVGMGRGTTFNVTATTIGMNGKRSAVVKLTLHK